MIIVNFKKVGNAYESNLKYFDYEVGEHKAQFTIEKVENLWIVKKEGILLETRFKKLSDAKHYVQDLHYHVESSNEIDEGLIGGGFYTPGACITSEGNGDEYTK